MDELGIESLQIGEHQELLDGGVVAHVAIQFRIGVSPLLRGPAKQGHVQEISLGGVGNGGLCGSDDGGNQVGLHGVGVDDVIELREGAIEIPSERETPAFVDLQALKLLDQVELELDRYPGGELEGDIFVGVGAAVAAGLGDQADRTCAINPALGGQDKTVQARLFSNPLEFDGIKIGVVQLLPDAEKLNGVPIAQPVLDDRIRSFGILVAGNIGKTYVVVGLSREDGNRRAPDFDGGFRRFAHD